MSKWFVTPISKPFRPFGRGTSLLRGLTKHGYSPLTGMILQVQRIPCFFLEFPMKLTEMEKSSAPNQDSYFSLGGWLFAPQSDSGK